MEWKESTGDGEERLSMSRFKDLARDDALGVKQNGAERFEHGAYVLSVTISAASVFGSLLFQ